MDNKNIHDLAGNIIDEIKQGTLLKSIEERLGKSLKGIIESDNPPNSEEFNADDYKVIMQHWLFKQSQKEDITPINPYESHAPRHAKDIALDEPVTQEIILDDINSEEKQDNTKDIAVLENENILDSEEIVLESHKDVLEKESEDDEETLVLTSKDIDEINSEHVEKTVIKEKTKKPWRRWPLLILLLAALLFSFIKFKNARDAKAKEESYNSTLKTLVVDIDQNKGTPVFEVGDELTYSDTDIKELKNIPDQFRSLFKSVPEGSTITMDDVDLKSVGEKDVVLRISKKDKYDQEVTNTQSFKIALEDTQEPEVSFKASSIKINNLNDIKLNIESVIDPVFGEYKYSDSGEPQTYKIDTSSVDWEKGGTYPVKVSINDNGNIIEYTFDVILEQQETINISPVVNPENNNANNSTNNNTNNGSNNNQNSTSTQPQYVYVDQFGNKYTQADVDAMSNGSYHFVDKDESGNNIYNAKTPEEEACYASYGQWKDNNCTWDDNTD